MSADACTQGLDTGFIELGAAKVAALGVVQGISELLPISSTAHMRIVPALLGWRDPGSAFSAAMQLAALAAVVSYFWSDIRGLFVGSVSAVIRRDFRDWQFRFTTWIFLATIPIAVAGKFLKPILNSCGSPLRGLRRDRGLLHRHGDTPSFGGKILPASPNDRQPVPQGRDACWSGSGRRLDSRCFAIGFNFDRGHVS